MQWRGPARGGGGGGGGAGVGVVVARCSAARRRQLRKALACAASAARDPEGEDDEDDDDPAAPAPEADMFREQVNTMAAWFEQWNECEQTVALYSLLKRLAPPKARFLATALDQSLADCPDLHLHEQQANNPGFVGSLLAESKETALEQLLLHLPLLRPGNYEAKSRYLAVVHKVLSHSVETGAHIEEARQLLSYSLIHPGITNEDRRSLTQWLRHLEDRITSSGSARSLHFSSSDSPHHQQPQSQLVSQQIPGQPNGPGNSGGVASSSSSSWGSGSGLHFGPQMGSHTPMKGVECISNRLNGHFFVQNCNSTPLTSSHGSCGNFTNGSHPRVRRSNSLTPPVSITQSSDLWSSQDDLSGRQKPRSFSLSSEHAPPLSPQSSLPSSGSGSESHLDDLRQGFTGDATGMKDVPAWLKSLRLHKYVTLFAQLSYDEMLSLTDEKLAAQGVTKGARHKIILSIRKLKERYHTLCQLEKDVSEGTNLCAALEELKNILLSPIKAKDVGSSLALTVPALSPSASLSPGSATSSPILFPGSSTPTPSPGGAGAIGPPTLTVTGVSDISQVEGEVQGETRVPACQEREETDDAQGTKLPRDAEGKPPNRAGEADEGTEWSTKEGDIPAQFTKVMGKVCTQLLVSTRAEEEAARLFMRLLERALQHEAFTAQQKRRLTTWKLQVQDVWSPLTAAMGHVGALGPSCSGPGVHRAGDSRHSRHRWHSHSQFASPSLPHHPHHPHHPHQHPHHHHHNGFPHHLQLHRPLQQTASSQSRFPPPPPPPLPTPGSTPSRGTLNKTASPLPTFVSASLFPPSTSTAPVGTQGQMPGQHRNSLTVLGVGAGQTGQFMAKRPSLQDPLPEPMDSHSTLQRTRSAPLKASHFSGLSYSPSTSSPSTSTSNSSRTPSTDASGANDPEINSRLESLCLSMTEHALGGCNEV